MFPWQEKKIGTRNWAQLIFLGLILCISVYLIIFSLLMIAANINTIMTSDAFMLAVAMIGVACTMIWFAVGNFKIESTEEKLETLTERLDNIINKLEKK